MVLKRHSFFALFSNQDNVKVIANQFS